MSTIMLVLGDPKTDLFFREVVAQLREQGVSLSTEDVHAIYVHLLLDELENHQLNTSRN